MKCSWLKGFAGVGTSLSLLFVLTACGGSSSTTSSASTSTSTSSSTALTITSANATISATTQLASLVIGDTLPTAADGYSLTLTVDGVETPIAAGTFTSSSSTGVVLEVTTEIPVTYGSANTDGTYTYSYDWRTAVYVQDGAPVLAKSVTSAVQDLTLTSSLTSLDAPKITSVGAAFNGIVVTTSTATSSSDQDPFLINNANISLTGNGGDGSTNATTGYTQWGNDFSGWGAGLVVAGYAKVSLDTPYIYTKGVVRTAVLVKEHGELTVNGGVIAAHDDTMPTDYIYTAGSGQPQCVVGGYMCAAPWLLGIQGTTRATNLLGKGTATYNGVTISAENWAALSVDENDGVVLNANDCNVSVAGSGYASYAIGNTTANYTGCTVNVPDMVFIVANAASSVNLSGGVATSGRFGVMGHSDNAGTVKINNGAVLTTGEALFQLKNTSTTIVVDNATLTSSNGILLETVINDDPGGADSSESSSSTNTPNATFTNTTITGNVYNANPFSQLTMTIGKGATITGLITNAWATSVMSADEAAATAAGYTGSAYYTYLALHKYADIGEFTVSTARADWDTHFASDGGKLSLKVVDGGSWVVTGPGYLSSLSVDSNSSVTTASSGTASYQAYTYDSTNGWQSAGLKTAITAGTSLSYTSGTYYAITID